MLERSDDDAVMLGQIKGCGDASLAWKGRKKKGSCRRRSAVTETMKGVLASRMVESEDVEQQ
jgi:hypothetical protein